MLIQLQQSLTTAVANAQGGVCSPWSVQAARGMSWCILTQCSSSSRRRDPCQAKRQGQGHFPCGRGSKHRHSPVPSIRAGLCGLTERSPWLCPHFLTAAAPQVPPQPNCSASDASWIVPSSTKGKQPPKHQSEHPPDTEKLWVQGSHGLATAPGRKSSRMDVGTGPMWAVSLPGLHRAEAEDGTGSEQELLPTAPGQSRVSPWPLAPSKVSLELEDTTRR